MSPYHLVVTWWQLSGDKWLSRSARHRRPWELRRRSACAAAWRREFALQTDNWASRADQRGAV